MAESAPNATTTSQDLVADFGAQVDAEGVRDHLVATAVKFLQNPKVRSTSLAKKREFLASKGLSPKEIETAFTQAGAYISLDNNNNNMAASKALIPYTTSISTRTSLLLKAMDVANMIALISIGSYSLYSLWKNYIAPRIFGTRSRLEQKYERLLESITQLNSNVVELREIFRDIQLGTGANSNSSPEIQDLRKELVAIKSLLLGRSQFPPSPSASTSGIPSWQMVEGEVRSDNSHSDESGGSRKVVSRKKDKPSSRRNVAEELEASVIRKHPSSDLHSESSCEVVFLGKNDSSDPDHSE